MKHLLHFVLVSAAFATFNMKTPGNWWILTSALAGVFIGIYGYVRYEEGKASVKG